MLIKNAKVFLASENGFFKKDIETKGSKIVKVADSIEGKADIDASGKYIMPGIIEAHSHIGMIEEGNGWAGQDLSEYSEPCYPEARAVDGFNPQDIALGDALSGGVTVALTGAGSGAVITGQSLLTKLSGDIVDDMAIRKVAAMKCALGENPKRVFGSKKMLPETRQGTALLLRKFFYDTLDYINKKENNKDYKYNFKLEALIPVIKREIPIKVHAHRADDICTAIRIAEEFNLKMTIDHCTEGHLIVDYLKKFDYPVIVGPTFTSRSKIEMMNKSFETAGILNRAGLKVCITTDHNVTPQESLVTCTALCVKHGMDEAEALKAITKNPAEVLEIDDIKGEIKEGLDFDLSIWDRHPLDIQAHVLKVFLEGKEVYNE